MVTISESSIVGVREVDLMNNNNNNNSAVQLTQPIPSNQMETVQSLMQ